MSAPFLWITVPLSAGVILAVFSKNGRFTTFFLASLCLFLGFISLTIPVNSMILFGKRSIIFSSSTTFLGRTLALERSAQPVIAFFFFFAAAWILGSLFVNVNRFFVPMIVVDIALLAAVLAVDYFIYGAFLVMVSVLITVPLLWYEKKGDTAGIVRMVFYQMLGMIFMVLGGWLATTVDQNPADTVRVTRTVLLFFLGLEFWLAIFPFYSWIAMLMDDACPVVYGAFISLVQFSALFILMEFLSAYIWMRSFDPLFVALRITGLMMLLVGAVMAYFQDSLQRMTGYICTAQNGILLLLLGIRSAAALNVFLSSLFLYLLSLLIWSLSCKSLSESLELSLPKLRGLVGCRPFLCVAMLTAFFTLAGMPLLAGFPLRVSLLTSCFGLSHVLGWGASLGCLILLMVGFRLSVTLLTASDLQLEPGTLQTRIFFVVSISILLLLSVFPDLFRDFISEIQNEYMIIAG